MVPCVRSILVAFLQLLCISDLLSEILVQPYLTQKYLPLIHRQGVSRYSNLAITGSSALSLHCTIDCLACICAWLGYPSLGLQPITARYHEREYLVNLHNSWTIICLCTQGTFISFVWSTRISGALFLEFSFPVTVFIFRYCVTFFQAQLKVYFLSDAYAPLAAQRTRFCLALFLCFLDTKENNHIHCGYLAVWSEYIDLHCLFCSSIYTWIYNIEFKNIITKMGKNSAKC